jgi:hypothetical protein
VDLDKWGEGHFIDWDHQFDDEKRNIRTQIKIIIRGQFMGER